MNRRAQLLCAWCGPVLTVLFFIGFVPLAQFIPPPDPTDSAQEIKAFYLDNLDGIRIGMFVMMISMAMIAPWGVAIATQTRRTEKGFPVLTYTQVACVAIGTLIAVLFCVVWGWASFRPDDISAEVTRSINDFGWFLFLFDWSPFTIWCGAVALAILFDKSETPVFPRWAAYLSLWTGFLFIPAGLMVFFKTGAFAFNGLLAMYIPLFIFFIWVIAMTVLVIKAINREAAPAAVGELPSEQRFAQPVGSGGEVGHGQPAGQPG